MDKSFLRRTKWLDTTPTAVTFADLSQPDMPLVLCNPAFTKLTGYDADEVIGKNCRFLQGDMGDQAARSEIRRAIELGASTSVVLTNFTKDGTAFRNLLYLSPLKDKTGDVRYFMGCQYELPAIPTMDAIVEHAGSLNRISVQLRENQERSEDAIHTGFDIRSEVTFALARAVFH